MNGNDRPSAKPSTSGKVEKATIDYRELQRRLATARAAIEQGWQPTPEESRGILTARAQALAAEAVQQEPADECIEVVEFQLAYERYAVESRYVREIYPLESLTPLPCAPPFVLGIINLRGEILSVIDIKVFFELPAQGLTDLNKVIVLQMDSMVLGVLADAVNGVHRVRIGEIQPSLPTLANIRDAYLKGLMESRLVILDGEKLLSDTNIIVNEQVREQ